VKNTEVAHTQEHLDTFCATLAGQYRTLFVSDPDYAHVASRLTPEALARKMTLGLDNGTANKDGKAIRNACRFLGIDFTYKAIRAYLSASDSGRPCRVPSNHNLK